MKSIITLALACFAAGAASIATAQVGLGGGVVGTLGANGSASRIGGIGSGISTGTTMRGAELRQAGQLSAETRGQTNVPATTGNAAGGINTDTTVKPGGVNTDVKAGGGATAAAPVVSGSAWGSADAGVDATTPDAKETVRDTKAAARQKADKLESRRDKIEDKGDKTVDKALQ